MRKVSVRLKFKPNSNKWSSKTYTYLCPLKNIETGDCVLVTVKKGNGFSVGKIVSIDDEDRTTAYAMIVCKLPVADIDGRLATVRDKQVDLFTKANRNIEVRDKTSEMILYKKNRKDIFLQIYSFIDRIDEFNITEKEWLKTVVRTVGYNNSITTTTKNLIVNAIDTVDYDKYELDVKLRLYEIRAYVVQKDIDDNKSI